VVVVLVCIRSIERSVEATVAAAVDAIVKYFLCTLVRLTSSQEGGHLQVGSLAGAARVGKDSRPDQRSAHAGQDSAVEFKSISWLDGDLKSKGRRCESRV